MKNISGYLLDLDGTVYRGAKLIPGADRVIARLRARGRRLVFLSNKPLAPRRDYAEKLACLGVPAREEEVINSSYVMARYLARIAPHAPVYAIGEPPLIAELREAGLVISEDYEHIEYVVVAFDRTFDYQKLNLAFQAIRRGAHFVATNPDRTCPVEGGEIPDAAGMIAAVEAVTGKRVEEIVGKPSKIMIEAALAQLELPAARVAIVGDRLKTDIAMGQGSDLMTILTLTGVNSRDDLQKSAIQPDRVIGSLAELPALDDLLNAS
ncbi:MAG TPA: HAD-IIA family hydrolase [Candidatus Fraserbacteria bacterium]|nr:HAD-IIA family hydrolase [Candidatus Fraserbacteria bacterium]